jgi:hypothetical protein
MIQIYDRDAAVVTEILSIIADLRQALSTGAVDNPPAAAAYDQLVQWVPADSAWTHPGEMSTKSEEHALVSARLRSIVFAVNDQLEPPLA